MSKIFGVFDVKSDSYLHVMVLNTRAMAIRAFSDVANDTSSQINKHPEDYRLMVLAEFDESTGVIVPIGVESLGFASEYVSKKE